MNQNPKLVRKAPGVSMPNDWSRMGPDGMAMLRQWVRDQKKAVGLIVTTAAGNQVRANLNIPQQGKFLLGFGFSGVIPNGPVNILVNNEKFIDELHGSFLDVAQITEEFYYYPRPLTGIDKLVLEITDSGAQQVRFAAYYI